MFNNNVRPKVSNRDLLLGLSIVKGDCLKISFKVIRISIIIVVINCHLAKCSKTSSELNDDLIIKFRLEMFLSNELNYSMRGT